MNNCEVQEVGQKLVDPADKLRKESKERAELKRNSDNAVPKTATVVDKSISEKSGWEEGTEGTPAERSRNFPGKSALVHAHSRNSGDEVPVPTQFESDINHDPRERSSGRKLRKAK